MNKDIQETGNDIGTLTENARKRLSAALEGVCDRTVAGVRSAGHAVHEHPYPIIGVALGVGALIGYLLTRRNGR